MKIKCPCCGDIVDAIPFEIKDTDQSSTRAIEENIAWVRQVMNQCYVVGSCTGKLSRMCNLGNWKWVYRPKDPVKIQALVDTFGKDWMEHPTLSAWRMDFTQDELDRHWKWMLSRKQLFEEILLSGKLLPKLQALASGTEWKCKWCKYVEECERGQA